MTCKRLGSIIVLIVLLAFPASASMVSFLIVETGIGEAFAITQYTSLWEGGLMEAFFDAGHIVTNSPIMRMEEKPSRDLSGIVEIEFDEAVAGGAEYFVLGFMEYQIRGNRAQPVNISIKLYNTGSGKLVFEQGFPAGTGRNFDEEYRFAQNAGRTIISHLEGR